MKALLLAVTIVVLAASPAAAVTKHGNKNTNLTVKAKTVTTCTLATSPFSFQIGVGYIHSPGNQILSQKTLNVACTKGATTQIAMDNGLYGGAAGSKFGSRSMRDGTGDYLGYELCHDNACSSIWGTSGYTYVSPSYKGSSLAVWTRILTGQPQVKQGQYYDSITVTISF